MAFPARYHGRCAAGHPITPGDEVEYRGPRGEEQLFHVDCDDPTDTLSDPGPRPSRFAGTSLEEMGF